MKGIMLASLAAALTAAALPGRARSAAAAPTASQKGEIAVGEIFSITLPCNPTTGYEWEIKTIDRRIAVPTGPAEFLKSPAAPGTLGAGGTCVLRVKGVKPGKTKAVLVYRRSWEKVAPARTVSAEIRVLPKKKN